MLTANQIMEQARYIAKAPSGWVSQSQIALNLVLSDLAVNRNLRANLFTWTLNMPAANNGPFNLNVQHQRTYDVFFMQNGIPHEMNPIELSDYDAMIVSPQVTNFPTFFAVDSSMQSDTVPPVMYIYPQSNTPLACQHRYFGKRADITDFTLVPWFQDQQWLVHAVASYLMKLTNDDRWPAFVATGEEMLRKHLIMEGDRQRVPIRIRLDPTMYRTARNLKPTKLTD